MATGRLNAVLQQLRRLTPAAEADRTDAELLERFRERREEAAFAALVQRHGPMVLGVCRRVLQNPDDAEDVFQATFLILARKAAGIDKGMALGGWLHKVALRTALRARNNEASRRRHERQARAMQPNDAIAAIAWREVQAVLDEEVARLPDKYRVPFVLCYLEGKTYDRAAQQLRCVTGSISRRLAQARALLRQRLARRGLTLPAAVLASVLASAATSEAVPVKLATTTVKAALAGAAAKTAAGIISERVAALTEAGLKSLRVTIATIAVAVLLGVIAAGVGLLAWAAPSETSSGRPAQSGRRPSATTKERADQGRTSDAGKITVTGLVRDAAGKPMADAAVALLGRPKALIRIVDRWPPLKVLGQGKTDGEGHFRLTVDRAVREGYWDVFAGYEDMFAVAARRGHGLIQVPFSSDTRRPNLQIQLPGEHVLRGRLVDCQGKAAGGVQVRLVAVAGKRSSGRPFWIDFSEPPQGFTPWPAAVTTDKIGRFSLRGLGPGWTVTVQARSDQFARQSLLIKPEDWKDGKETTQTLAPARIIQGTVTHADTGKPVANARLVVVSAGKPHDGRVSRLEARADAQGRFRLVPYAGEFFNVLAYPPSGQPYLLAHKELIWPASEAPKQEVSLELARGVLVRGTITEKPSGKPVAGASLYFERCRDDNPYFRADVLPPDRSLDDIAVSGPDGKFQIAVLPEPGALLVRGPTLDYLHVEVSNKKIHGDRVNPDWRNYLDAFVELRLKPQPGPHDVAVALHRGVTLTGTVLAPDGKPVPQAALVCRSYIPYGHTWNGLHVKEVKDGRFELPGCDPERPTEVFIFARKEKLGAVAELSAKKAATKPVTVRLRPCGSATFRLVSTAGKPVRDVRPAPEFIITPGVPFADSLSKKGPVADTCHLSNLDPDGCEAIRADARGRVTLPLLIPGATYLAIGRRPDGRLINLTREFKAEAGKTIDLGLVIVRD
jgi:RNA polymerase sigma factor (sigma-70 family)